MSYNFRHKRWQLNVLKSSNFIPDSSNSQELISSSDLSNSLTQNSRQSLLRRLRYALRLKKWLDSDLPFSGLSSKAIFVLMPLMMLPYSYTTLALSATTANTIQGTAPYLTLDNGVTKVTTTDGLLGITLSDGTHITPLNNTSTVSNPIKLPVAGQTLADVGMLIPITSSTIALSTLIGAPNNYWGDDDGDGQGIGGITATGGLSVAITDASGTSINRSDTLDACNAPYKLELTSTAGTLSTQYGAPRDSSFTASSESYYITPNITTPYVCWARPNFRAPISDPSYTAWDPAHGFKLQNIATPASNFPTVGSNGLFFYLVMAGVSWSDITYKKSPTTSGIDITLSAPPWFLESNLAKVMLTGPKDGDTATKASTAVPTTFTLYSDAAKTKAIYSFTIGKWFIAYPTPVAHYLVPVNYCATFGYSVPTVAQYTNGNGVGWTGGISGQDNYFSRRIGGGLLAEWGELSKTSYPDSNFKALFYWTSVTIPSGGSRYSIRVTDGNIRTPAPNNTVTGAACVK